MKIMALAAVSVVLSSAVWAQNSRTLQKVMELKISGEGGANGACVAWHPLQKKYYAAMAGNVSFPMNVFDARGNLISPPGLTTLFDVRGLWYNPDAKKLQANGYNDFGWTEYKLDAGGMPQELANIVSDMQQPTEQSVGAFNIKTKQVCFLNEEGAVAVYAFPAGVFSHAINLHLSLTKGDDDRSVHNEDLMENYNYTTLVYTGIPNAEFGLLNVAGKQIELYSEKDGYLTQTLTLPGDAPVEEKLNFAFAKGIYWLFDRDARKWIGYH